jgi:hypothetical protein
MDEQKKAAMQQEHERQNNSMEFELCLKRIISLAKNRENLDSELRDFAGNKDGADYFALDEVIKSTIKTEAKFLANL